MCRRGVLTLEPAPQAAGAARRFVAASCHRWGVESIDEISLAVSELVTNAVLHARTSLEVALSIAADTLEVSVRDREPRPPVLRPVRLDLLSDLDAISASAALRGDVDERHQGLHVGPSGSIAAGRGLLIVDALADEWGVSERADGKEVWLTLPVSWAHRSGCQCLHATSRTASGLLCEHIPGEWDDEEKRDVTTQRPAGT
jgi:anti-sigma regulatory factor (Ser/Thr protein kinase)